METTETEKENARHASTREGRSTAVALEKAATTLGGRGMSKVHAGSRVRKSLLVGGTR